MPTTPTRAQIEKASKTITGVPAAMLVSLIRQSEVYAGNPGGYVNLESVISGVNDSVKAQQLNAALTLIDEIGPGETEIKGDEDAVHHSVAAERAALVRYCICVLYDAPAGSLFGFARRTSSSIPAPAKW